MKILALTPVSTSNETDNLEVTGASDGASAQNDLTKLAVGTINNPYGHVDSAHVENLIQFFTGYTQLSSATFGGWPHIGGTSRFVNSNTGDTFAFIDDVRNFASGEYAVILEGSNGYSPNLLLASYTTMNETVPITGAGIMPVANASTVQFQPTVDPLPATVGGNANPIINLTVPWENAPLSTSQLVIPDFFTTSGAGSWAPNNPTPFFSQTASGSNVVTVGNNAGIVAGIPVSGQYVPANTTVTANSNIATITGVSNALTSGSPAPNLVFTVSGYTAGVPFSAGDSAIISGANPSTYNTVGTASIVTASTASFTITDTYAKSLSGIVANGTQVVFTTSAAHGYSVGDSIVTGGTGVSAFNFATAQPIVAVTTNTVTISSTATGSYTSGGYISTSCQPWVANNAIATGNSQITISNNATGAGSILLPFNVVTFSGGNAGSFAPGRIITDNINNPVGVISSVDSSGNFVTLTGNAVESLDGTASVFAATPISNMDSTTGGAASVQFYDSYNTSIVVAGNSAELFGASAGQTTTGWTTTAGSAGSVTYTVGSGYNNYQVGQYISITGFTPVSYNTTGAYITNVTPTTITIASTATASPSGTGTIQAIGSTYYGYNSFAIGQTANITGFSATAFNVSGQIIAQNPQLFQIASSLTATASGPASASVTGGAYQLPTLTTASISAANSTGPTNTGGLVTYTCSNSFVAGQVVSITGFTTTAYNQTFATIANATSTQFSIYTNTVPYGNATGTGTATLNPPVYDAGGTLIGYTASNATGATFTTYIGNPSVSFSIQAPGSWNGYNPSTTTIQAGQYVFPFSTYNPMSSPTAYSNTAYDATPNGIIPGMWFTGLYNNGTQIIPPCLITYVDYTNYTITLASSAVANLSTNIGYSKNYLCVATTNNASSTLNNKVVVGSSAFFLNSSVSSISAATRTATVTTASAHGFNVGMPVIIAGATGTNSGNINGTWIVQSVPNANSFTYFYNTSTTATFSNAGITASNCGLDPNGNSTTIVSGTVSGNNVTFAVTDGVNFFNIGQYLNITGCNQPFFNLTSVPVTATSATDFTITIPTMTASATTTLGSSVIGIANSNTTLYPGMGISGSGIPSGTTIVYASGSSATLSKSATATNYLPVALTLSPPSTFDASSAPTVFATVSMSPYSSNTADNISYTQGIASGSGIPSGTTLSTTIPATANGTTYLSIPGSTAYSVADGDLVYGTNIPLGTTVVSSGADYTTGNITSASATASSGTVTYNGASGFHQFVVGQTVTIAGTTGTNANNTNAYNLYDAYVTATAATSFTVKDPTITNITAASSTGSTYTYTTPSHNLNAGDYVTISGLSVTAYNGTYPVASTPDGATFTITKTPTAAAITGQTGYATQVIGTVTASGGNASSDQVLRLSNSITAGATTLNIYSESSYNSNYSANGNGYAILSQAFTGTLNTPTVITTAGGNFTVANTIDLGGGNYSTTTANTLFQSANSSSVIFTSSAAQWNYKAVLATTGGNKFLANITSVPSLNTTLQITNLQSVPIAQATQGSTSATVYVSSTSGFTIGQKYMIQNFVVTVTGINALNSTIAVSPAFSPSSPLVLNSTPYPNGDANKNNFYNYETDLLNTPAQAGFKVQLGSFINSTTYSEVGAGAFATSSNITRRHLAGMFVGAYTEGNRYFGSNTNQDFESVYITSPTLGSHVGTTLNQPVSAQLDTQFIVNPAATTFTTYTDPSGYTLLPNKTFIDLTLGSANNNSVRNNYVVIVGSGTRQEAVLISGQYQTTDNSDVSTGTAGPVAWKLADGQVFQYDHLAGEPVVTPNVNLSQNLIIGDVVYAITNIAHGSPIAGEVTYTTSLPHGLSTGMSVVVTGCVDSGSTTSVYNTTGATVISVTPNTFVIANSGTATVSTYGSVTSKMIYVSQGLHNLEVGQPIYSLYGNIPTGTTVTKITPDTGSTNSGFVAMSNPSVNNTQTVANVTSASLSGDGASIVYAANNNFTVGQQLSIAITSSAASALSQSSAYVTGATPTTFSTAIPASGNPYQTYNISQIVPNNVVTIASASYNASTQQITYNYVPPFPGYSLQAGASISITGMTPTTLNLSGLIIPSSVSSSQFTVSRNLGNKNIISTHSGVGTANLSTAVAYYTTTTFAGAVGQQVSISGVVPNSYNSTITISAVASGASPQYFVVAHNNGPTIKVVGGNGLASLLFTTVLGSAVALNEPLGTGFSYAHSADTPVLGGADTGTIAALGYKASPSVIGSNPSKTTNAVVEMRSTFTQPWLSSGDAGIANISAMLAQSNSAGDTTLSIDNNSGFPTAYPTLTQAGVNFLPPKIGRVAGAVAAGSISIPVVITDQLPTSFPYIFNFGAESVVIGSISSNLVTVNGTQGNYYTLNTYALTGTTTASSSTTITGITSSAFTYLSAGQGIVGAGLASGTTISTVTASANSITISNPVATAGTYNFSLATASAHPDLTPAQLASMPVNMQYTTLEVPYVYLTQSLAIGNSYTTLSTTPLPCNLAAGTTLYLQSGNYGQTITLSASAVAGATSISANSFIAQYIYTATVGSSGAISTTGSYITTGLGTSLLNGQTVVLSQQDSLSVWHYQPIIVGKTVSQNNLNVSFQPFLVEYPFDSNATVFAPYAISLDSGDALETVYPVTIPVSQSPDGYSAPYILNVLSPLTYNHSVGATFQYFTWPANPAIGDITYRPDLTEFFMYDGSDWRLSRILGVQGVYGMLGATNG